MDNKQPTKKVELRKSHEHAGRVYPKGSELTLPVSKGDWLIATKVAKEAEAESAPVDEAAGTSGPDA